jgi:hypothetical protein
MRTKIPQLREALQSRFQVEHHGIMVAQLLAHIDALDTAGQNLSERIEYVLTRTPRSSSFCARFRASKRTPLGY